MLTGSKDRTRTPSLDLFNAPQKQVLLWAFEPRDSLHRFPYWRQRKSILVRFPEQSATQKQPNICHFALRVGGVLSLQGQMTRPCVMRNSIPFSPPALLKKPSGPEAAKLEAIIAPLGLTSFSILRTCNRFPARSESVLGSSGPPQVFLADWQCAL